MNLCHWCNREVELSPAAHKLFNKFASSLGLETESFADPKLCRECRLQRRWSFRNQRVLFRSASSLSQSPIISVFPPDSGLTVYAQHEWWDPGWDGTEYGREIDFTRPFFEQFNSLLRHIPHPNLINAHLTNDNCDYCNCTAQIKDCYMNFDSSQCIGAYHSSGTTSCRDCLDITGSCDCELCFDSVNSNGCYSSFGLAYCVECRDCAFCLDCRGCSECYQCSNLRNARYCWKNEQLTPDDFKKRWRALALDTRLGYETAQREFLASRSDFPVRGYRLTNCEDSFGDSLSASKNAIDCFDSAQLEDCEASYHVTKARDCMDIQHTHDAELCFELMASTGVYNCHFSANPIQSRDILYSYLVTSCRNCFGCAGLKSQKFCIFNTPYSESEYRTLRARLIRHMQDTGEWGEFFPPEISLYPYNHTLAAIYFPEDTSTRNEKKLRALAPLPGIVEVQNALTAAELPNSLSTADDALFERAIVCERSKRPFRISKAELALRRKLSAPIITLHPDERFRDRLEFQNKKRLHPTNCAKCKASTSSIYDPAATAQKILCDRCYEALVYT